MWRAGGAILRFGHHRADGRRHRPVTFSHAPRPDAIKEAASPRSIASTACSGPPPAAWRRACGGNWGWRRRLRSPSLPRPAACSSRASGAAGGGASLPTSSTTGCPAASPRGGRDPVAQALGSAAEWAHVAGDCGCGRGWAALAWRRASAPVMAGGGTSCLGSGGNGELAQRRLRATPDRIGDIKLPFHLLPASEGSLLNIRTSPTSSRAVGEPSVTATSPWRRPVRWTISPSTPPDPAECRPTSSATWKPCASGY